MGNLPVVKELGKEALKTYRARTKGQSLQDPQSGESTPSNPGSMHSTQIPKEGI